MPETVLERAGAADPEIARIEDLVRKVQACRAEIAKVVVGQETIVAELMIGLLSGGHVLLEGVPGVGKTLLARTMGRVTGLESRRIQFTPDLMPGDITGAYALGHGEAAGHSVFQPGPIFTQILLADEINRATPKTQSALLEAMQEKTVTVGGHTMTLQEPFFVLATENPIEMEGTYPLPEAQVDRFMIKSIVRFPSAADIVAILDRTTGSAVAEPVSTLTAGDILHLQGLVRSVVVARSVLETVARFTTATQPDDATSPEAVKRYVRIGVSPRGAGSWLLAAKAHALLAGRYNVAISDLRAMLLPALRHRIQLNYEGRADRVSGETVLTDLFAAIAGPRA